MKSGVSSSLETVAKRQSSVIGGQGKRRPGQLEQSEDEAAGRGNVKMGSRAQTIQRLKGHAL